LPEIAAVECGLAEEAREKGLAEAAAVGKKRAELSAAIGGSTFRPEAGRFTCEIQWAGMQLHLIICNEETNRLRMQ
jgi:hypothetical protein